MTTFTITRTFDAPRPLVFDCWTSPEHIGKWFSPPCCTTELVHSDIRPGGYNIAIITSPDGSKSYGKHEFKEISPVDRLVFINSSVDENGNQIRHPMAPDWPLELLTTVTFREVGHGTELTLTWIPIDATEAEDATFAQALDGCTAGWTGTFDVLSDYLKGIN
jgi:uncharacterized protein YndB with AHSA1/START domain